MRALVEAGIDNYVTQVMDQRLFRQRRRGQVSVPQSVHRLSDRRRSGRPMTFTKAEVLANVPAGYGANTPNSFGGVH
jgi:hypothetical protein